MRQQRGAGSAWSGANEGRAYADGEPRPLHTEEPGGDYNVLPYTSMPYAWSDPARMAATARLFGLGTRDVTQARVLEIGCASGGNLIPLAAKYPDAQFLGIDLSTRHISEGRQRIAELGLANIMLQQADVVGFEPAGPFDFIICHGVFSWIPRAAQEAVLHLCADHLSPDGVAYISYNIYPGWHLRGIVRDISLHHAGQSGTPQLRVARARWMLDQLARSTNDQSPYGHLLRREAEIIGRQDDSYVLGEFLAEENKPCYFREFADRIQARGLAYLCEADVVASVPENLAPETARLIRAIAGEDGRAVEQYIDFFTGRAFRRSLLVRAGTDAELSRRLAPDHLVALHLSSAVLPDGGQSTDRRWVFRHRDGRPLTTNDPLAAFVLQSLSSVFPETLTPADLMRSLSAAGFNEREAGERLLRTLLTAVLGGFVTAAAVPMRVGRANQAKPAAWRLARCDAAAHRRWATGLTHEHFALDEATTHLLAAMDGNRDRAALVDVMSEAMTRGAISPKSVLANGASEGEDASAAIAAFVESSLARFERSALIAPG